MSADRYPGGFVINTGKYFQEITELKWIKNRFQVMKTVLPFPEDP
jgi:hypothetical protein